MKVSYTIPAGFTYSPALLDLIEGNHVLIAGTTGAGKSVLENAILNAILCARFPFSQGERAVNLVLIDPKKVELRMFKDLPHVIKYADNIADIEKAFLCVRQMIDERLKRMQRKGLRKSQESPVYVFIDELVDLMTSTRKKDLLRILSDSASISRATNIFFVCLTQSPARVIIPAQFKLLFNCRVALRCNNAIESRQIIDDDSAAKLPRYGLAIVQQDIDRYQLKINMVSDEQLQALVKSWNKQHPIITRLTRPR